MKLSRLSSEVKGIAMLSPGAGKSRSFGISGTLFHRDQLVGLFLSEIDVSHL
jgi:hypothetical protein